MSYEMELSFLEFKKTKTYDKLLVKERKTMELVKKFQKRFKKTNLSMISLDEYVLGKGKNTFCYWVENELNDYGNIHGSNALKFGIYYGKTISDSLVKYRWVKRFGKNVLNEHDVMKNISSELAKLVDIKNVDNYKLLAKNLISPMFKIKILSLYYPEKFIPIYSDEHLKRILSLFEVDCNASNSILLNKTLLDYKKNSSVFAEISNYIFANFLYLEFNDYIRDLINENKIEKLIKVDFDNLILNNLNNENTITLKKRDYERINKAKHIQGLKAELLVVKYEQNPEVIVKHVSQKNDSLGYDIEVINKKTKEILKYIEVKSSASGNLNNINFYITINELKKMKELENYFIYFVYNLKSNPKFIEITKEDIKVNPEPILFKYTLKNSDTSIE